MTANGKGSAAGRRDWHPRQHSMAMNKAETDRLTAGRLYPLVIKKKVPDTVSLYPHHSGHPLS
jgi:hypothetical protein